MLLVTLGHQSCCFALLKSTIAAFPLTVFKKGDVLNNILGDGGSFRGRSLALNLAPWQRDLSVSSLAIGGTLIWLQIWISLAKKREN